MSGIKSKTVKVTLFHLSFKDDLDGIWEPKPPAGIEDKHNSKYPEPETPRVSCSPTVEQCFQAIYPNISKYFEEHKYPYMEFYVYSPVFTGKERIWTPEYMTKNKLVHDAHMTDEYAILDDVEMRLVKKVKILNTKNSSNLNYRPFNDNNEPLAYFAPKTIIVVDLDISKTKNKLTTESFKHSSFRPW